MGDKTPVDASAPAVGAVVLVDNDTVGSSESLALDDSVAHYLSAPDHGYAC
jgi:hypothetical protein